jgi:hypothetical protein
VRLPDALADRLAFELLRRVERAFRDDPFLLVLFVLELPPDELLLEDRVVCAIVSRLSSAFRASSVFRAGGLFALPAGPAI